MPATLRILAAGPASGGVADAFSATVRVLRDAGHAVDVLRLPPAAVPALGAARVAARARRALRAADVVHVEFGANDIGVVFFALLATRLRRDCVVVAHDHPELAHAAGAGLSAARPAWAAALGHRVLSPALDRRIEDAVVRRAGVLVGLSATAAEQRRRRGARAVATIAHGPLPVPPAPPPSAGEAIVFAGYVGPSKGVDVLLAAWRQLRGEVDLALVVAGAATGPYADWLAGLLRELGDGPDPPRVLGALGEDEFAAVIAHAAIVVLPYRSSNPASGVLVRAMGAGRAIVTTAVPATRDLVRDGDTGVLVPAGDVAALAAAIRRLAGDGELRDRLGAAAAREAAAAFTPARHLEGLLAAYARAR